MQIMISYFNNLRHFKPTDIPLSTAMWDPKWFHENQGQHHTFLDKRGVINGLRAEKLVLPLSEWEKLVDNKVECRKECPFIGTDCAFMNAYYQHLSKLDFMDMIKWFELIVMKFTELIYGEIKLSKVDEFRIVLLVHEKPEKLCSERLVLQKWFKEHGLELKEYAS